MIKTNIPLILNNDHIVTNAGIHDAEVVEVRVFSEQSNRTVSIHLRSDDGALFELLLDGVRYFGMNYFGSQNIVFELSIFRKTDASGPLRQIKDLSRWTSETYENLAKLITEGELTLVTVTPSIGCELICLSKRIAFGTT